MKLIDIITILNATLIMYGIYMTRKHFNFKLTSEYIQRYNSADMLNSRIIVEVYLAQMKDLNENEQKEQFRKLLKSNQETDIKTRLHFVNFINLFTELGVAFRAGNVSRKVLFTFNAIVPRAWDNLHLFVEADRERNSPRKLYTSFEYLSIYLCECPFWVDGKLKLSEPIWQRFRR